MSGSARPPATYEDLLALPEHVVGEIIDGELVVSRRPGPRQANAKSALVALLVPPFQFGDTGPGGWSIMLEPEVHLGEDVVVPDLAGWRRGRMPHVPDEDFFSLPPDWVCEVLSQPTIRLDRTRKLPAYARAGVRHAWLIDPLAQTLELYRLEPGYCVLVATHGGSERVAAVPFEEIAIDLSWLWA